MIPCLEEDCGTELQCDEERNAGREDRGERELEEMDAAPKEEDRTAGDGQPDQGLDVLRQELHAILLLRLLPEVRDACCKIGRLLLRARLGVSHHLRGVHLLQLLANLCHRGGPRLDEVVGRRLRPCWHRADQAA